MEQFKVNLGCLGKGKATIYCRYVNTRSGFKHEAVAFAGGVSVAKTKCCYLNRTWESYTYQSVLYRVAEKIVKNAYPTVRNIFDGKHKKIERIYKNLCKRIDRDHGKSKYIVDDRIFA